MLKLGRKREREHGSHEHCSIMEQLKKQAGETGSLGYLVRMSESGESPADVKQLLWSYH